MIRTMGLIVILKKEVMLSHPGQVEFHRCLKLFLA